MDAAVGRYWEFGLHLGVALRIAEDVVGTWGAVFDSGKPTGSDIRRRKRTLPVVYALGHAAEQDRQVVASLYSLTTYLSSEQELRVREVLAGCGAAAFVVAQAEVHCRRASAALQRAAGGPEQLEANRSCLPWRRWRVPSRPVRPPSRRLLGHTTNGLPHNPMSIEATSVVVDEAASGRRRRG